MTRNETGRSRRLTLHGRVGTLIALTGLSATACLTQHVLIPYGGPVVGPPEEFAEIPAGLDESGTAPLPAEKKTGGQESRLYRTVDIRIPSKQDDGQPGSSIAARLFESRLPGLHPLVIILPIYGSQYRFPSNNLTALLLLHGKGQTDVLQVQSNASVLAWDLMRAAQDPAAFHAASLITRGRIEASVVDIRRLIDWVVTQPGVDPARIGLVGFSLGGLIGSLVLVSDPRIRAAALVMTGAHPADVLAECIWEAKDVRETIMKRFDWTLTLYRQEMEDIFGVVDVAHLKSLVDPKRMLLVDATSDSCFLEGSRNALWEAMGQPRRIAFAYDHQYSFVSMTFLGGNYLTDEIVRLFDQSL